MADNVTLPATGSGDATPRVATFQRAGGEQVQYVRESFVGGQALPDQSGAGGVLTFTFSSPVDLFWVRSVGGVSRADPFGGTPSVSAGVYCGADEPTPLSVTTTTVRVFAPAGATVSVWGFRG